MVMVVVEGRAFESWDGRCRELPRERRGNDAARTPGAPGRGGCSRRPVSSGGTASAGGACPSPSLRRRRRAPESRIPCRRRRRPRARRARLLAPRPPARVVATTTSRARLTRRRRRRHSRRTTTTTSPGRAVRRVLGATALWHALLLFRAHRRLLLDDAGVGVAVLPPDASRGAPPSPERRAGAPRDARRHLAPQNTTAPGAAAPIPKDAGERSEDGADGPRDVDDREDSFSACVLW